ncbi:MULTISPECIES: hypothetical protein [Anaerolinea]|uniref:WD40/YVTN/BNR-like repeat-containing protein n=1 Tax=Anaerolinea TaxID=233189 RepID=UPI00261DF0B7|nr:hypothetical protein [Anaerolinea thermophila]
MVKLRAWLVLLACFASLFLLFLPVHGEGEPPFSTYLPLISSEPPPQWVGPYGGSVVALETDPRSPNIVYAGTFGAGVYKSTDGGVHWFPARDGLTNLMINSLAVDALHPSTLYAGTYRSGVFKSTDGGLTWAPVNNGIAAGAIVYTLAVDPENSSRVYAGTRIYKDEALPPWKGILYKSEDGGNSWRAVLENVGGSDQQDWVYSIALLPRDPNILLAATHEHGAYLSRDYGRTWSPANTGVDDLSGRAVLFDPRYRNPSVAYMGVWHRTGFYKSTNDVVTWNLLAYPNVKVYGMALDPQAPENVYAATFSNHGVLKSGNGGQSWAVTGLTNELVYSVLVNPDNSALVYAGVVSNGIYRSSDGAKSWSNMSSGLAHLNVTGLAIVPGIPPRWYAAVYGRGIFLSTDQGQTWTPVNSGLGNLNLRGLFSHPTSPTRLFALTEGGLYRLDAPSSAWMKLTLVGEDTGTAAKGSVPPLPVSPPDPLTLLMPDGAPAMQTSALPSTAMLTLAFAPSDAGVAYLGTGGAGVYKSMDGGLTWNAAGLNGQSVTALAVHPASPQQVYAATSSGAVQRSEDGGSTWTPIPAPGGSVYALATDPAEPVRVYAGTASGVYRWDGSAWSALGLTGRAIFALWADAARAGRWIAAGQGGAFLSEDGGMTWVELEPQLRALNVNAVRADPAEPHWMFFLTTESGTLRRWVR